MKSSFEFVAIFRPPCQPDITLMLDLTQHQIRLSAWAKPVQTYYFVGEVDVRDLEQWLSRGISRFDDEPEPGLPEKTDVEGGFIFSLALMQQWLGEYFVQDESDVVFYRKGDKGTVSSFDLVLGLLEFRYK